MSDELPDDPAPPAQAEAPAWLQRSLERERRARKTAEALLDQKSRELFDALQHAREAERRLQLALWASGEGIWQWDAVDQRFEVQGLEGDDLPWARPGLTVSTFFEQVHEDDRDSLRLAWRLHASGMRDDLDTAFRLRLAGDRVRWMRVRGRALQRAADGRALAITGTVKDVTDQRAAEHTLQLMAQAFGTTIDALAVVDEHWRIVQANESMLALVGGQPLDGTTLDGLIVLPEAATRATVGWQGESVLRRRGGEPLPVDVSVTCVAARAGQARCYIVALRDVSERRRAAQALERLALRDALTGLPNRAALDQYLATRLERSPATAFALMFIDLDGFKSVNDSFGHRAGDELLVGMARRLLGSLRGAFISRWGGDEFVVVLPDGSEDSALREAAQLVLATLNQPFNVGGHEVLVAPSIGAVCCPEHGGDAQTLLRRADAAMYAAKDGGGNGLVIFHAALDDGVQRRTRLQTLLRADAERNAFTFVAQPKVDADRRMTGAELLMRWSPDGFGPVSPSEFIPIAEQIGVIDLMGRHALHAAARTAAQVHALGSQARVAVNLSPRQLLRSDLERIILGACERNHAEPAWLELELTESALVADIGMVERLLVRLRRRGFSLALDDFGTGYSSLSHLRQLPFHKVKIDRSFVKDLHADARSRLVLEGITRLCGSLNLTTVAEGVETPEQFALLREAGVREFQGYLFARPQSLDQWFEALVGGAPL